MTYSLLSKTTRKHLMRMLVISQCLLPLVCLLAPVNLAAQQQGISEANPGTPPTWIDKILERLESQRAILTQARVFIHTDRNLYAAGDTVWFASYQTLGPELRPDSVNTLLYLDLFSPTGKLLAHHVLKTEHGFGKGQITLPEGIASGLYELRAYNSFMANTGPESYYQQLLEVVAVYPGNLACLGQVQRTTGASRDTVTTSLQLQTRKGEPYAYKRIELQYFAQEKWITASTATTNKEGYISKEFDIKDPVEGPLRFRIAYGETSNKGYSEYLLPVNTGQPKIQFYPEGGELVQDMDCRVGVEATDVYGKPLSLTATLLEVETNLKLGQLQTGPNGLGFVVVHPTPGMHYQLVGETTTGVAYALPLPTAKPEGIALRVEVKAASVQVLLGSNPNLASRLAGKGVMVLATQDGEVVYAYQQPVTAKFSREEIPFSALRPGTVRFTVFTEEGLPYAERLVYIPPTTSASVEMDVIGNASVGRGKVNLGITLADTLATQAMLSVSVVDANYITASNYPGADIASYLLLGSALKGPLSTLGNLNTPAAIDLAMMTRGWRRFKWQHVLEQDTATMKYPVERGLAISGRMTLGEKKPFAEQPVMLMAIGDTVLSRLGKTDAEGRFYFDGLGHTEDDTLSFTVRPVDGKKHFRLQIDYDAIGIPQKAFPELLEPPHADSPAPTSDPDSQKVEIQQRYRMRRISGGEYELDEVVVTGYKGQSLSKDEYFGKIYRNPTYSVDMDRYATTQEGIFFALQTVPGVQVFRSNTGTYRILIRGIATFGASTDPEILVDNIRVDAEFLNILNSRDIDHIDVFSGANASVFGTRGANGAICIYTRRGGLSYPDDSTSTNKWLSLPGLMQAREFYVPDYELNPYLPASFPMLTLFWKGGITQTSTRATSFSFFQNDTPSPLRITVQGLTTDGKPLFKQIEVPLPAQD